MQWVIFAALCVASVLIVTLILYLRKDTRLDTEGTLKEVQNLKSILAEIAFAIVTQLEREHGEKLGLLKLSSAVEFLMRLIPDQLKGQFNVQILVDIVEESLAAARMKWKQNPKLIEKK